MSPALTHLQNKRAETKFFFTFCLSSFILCTFVAILFHSLCLLALAIAQVSQITAQTPAIKRVSKKELCILKQACTVPLFKNLFLLLAFAITQVHDHDNHGTDTYEDEAGLMADSQHDFPTLAQHHTGEENQCRPRQ